MYAFGQRYQQEIDTIANSKKSDQAKKMQIAMLQKKWLGIDAFAGVPKRPKRK